MDRPQDSTSAEELVFEEIMVHRLRGVAVDLDASLERLSQEGRERVRGWIHALERRGLTHGIALPPESLGEFVLEGILGRGGMGIVYRAHQPSVGRQVALKVLPRFAATDPRRAERFLLEAKALASLHHPGIVRVVSAGQTDGLPWFAMELVDGLALGVLLAASANTPPPQRTGPAFLAPLTSDESTHVEAGYVALIARFVAEAAEAIDHAHAHGVMHRDVKPSNLMIDRTGHIRLIDFGLARALGDSGEGLTATHDLLGSPSYLPPEQLRSPRSEASACGDVYSLGVVLYESLAGRPPHDADDMATLLRQVASVPPLPLSRRHPGLPTDVVTICHTAIDRDPSRRYQTAGAFAADLRAFLAFRPIAARRPPWARRLVLASRRSPRAAAVGALGIGLVVLVVLARVVGQLRHTSDVRTLAVAVEHALTIGELDAAHRTLLRLEGIAPESVEVQRLERAVADAHCRNLTVRAKDLAHSLARIRIERSSLAARLTAAEVAARTTHVPRAQAEASLADRLAAEAIDAQLRTSDLAVTALAEQATEQLRFTSTTTRNELNAALAAALMEGWRHAVHQGDSAWADLCKARVLTFDQQGHFAAELEGRGRLDLTGPLDTEVFLFRYVPRFRVRESDFSARWVPVPCQADGTLLPGSYGADFRPGDTCIAVIDAGSSALELGDLVVAIDGCAGGGSYRVCEVRAGGPAAAAGVEPWARLLSVGGIVASDWAEIRTALDPKLDATVVVEQDGRELSYLASWSEDTYDALGAVVAPDHELLYSVPPPKETRLEVLREGKSIQVSIPAHRALGVRAAATAYPLVMDRRARLGTLPIRGLSLQRGEYLAFARNKAGMTTRCVFEVRLERPSELLLELPDASPSHDALWVGGGILQRGTDPLVSSTGLEAAEVVVPGFWIGRCEVTVAEWERFTSDPQVRQHIEATRSSTGRLTLVPRDGDEMRAFPTKQSAGRKFAVKQIAARDVAAYLEWRNAELASSESPWRVRLPSRDEWQRAAGSTRSRVFPWGDTWEAALTNGHWTRAQPRRCPVGTHLGDESALGLMDLAGNVAEWTSDTIGDGLVVYCGGSNQQTLPSTHRIQSDDTAWSHVPKSEVGFRLVFEHR